MQRLKDSGISKRLNLIYLANGKINFIQRVNTMSLLKGQTEVVQQSKARKKDDFLIAFSPVSNVHATVRQLLMTDTPR